VILTFPRLALHLCSQWEETKAKDITISGKKKYDEEKKKYDEAKKKYDEQIAKEDQNSLLIEKPEEPVKPAELKKKKVNFLSKMLNKILCLS